MYVNKLDEIQSTQKGTGAIYKVLGIRKEGVAIDIQNIVNGDKLSTT